MIPGNQRTVTRIAPEHGVAQTVLAAVTAASDADSAAVETALCQSIDPDALDRLFRADEGRTTILLRLVDCEVSVSSDGRVVASRVAAR